jgi:hypothetical protein
MRDIVISWLKQAGTCANGISGIEPQRGKPLYREVAVYFTTPDNDGREHARPVLVSIFSRRNRTLHHGQELRGGTSVGGSRLQDEGAANFTIPD